MQRYDMPSRLRTSILRRLQRRHLYDAASPWRLRITVTEFRLRPDIVALLPIPILGDDRLTLFVAPPPGTCNRGGKLSRARCLAWCPGQGRTAKAVIFRCR